jgi:hypothetical protein
MKRTGVIVSIACALAAVPLSASAAGDPLAQAKADLAKLTVDASTAGTAVAADADKADVARLEHDAKAGLTILNVDSKLLLIDAAAARKAGGDRTELRSLLHAARAQVKGFRSAVRSARAQAGKAAKRNRGSNGSAHSSSGRGSDGNEAGG